jgi:ABC-2 type transport system permease protein
MALGLFASAFARTEFQAVQFMPAVVFPQLLLCGLFAPRSAMAAPLRDVAYAFPLSYAFDALSRATHPGSLGTTFALDTGIVIFSTCAALGLGAATLRRRTG